MWNVFTFTSIRRSGYFIIHQHNHMLSCWRSQRETKGDSRDVAIIAFQCSHVVVFESPLHVRRLSVPHSYSYNRTDKGLPEPCLYMFLNTSELYSYFEKGCRKKCTRQSWKALWVVLSSPFFREIWKNWHERPWNVFASANGKEQK